MSNTQAGVLIWRREERERERRRRDEEAERQRGEERKDKMGCILIWGVPECMLIWGSALG